MRYSSPSHFDRSMSRQRSEQSGYERFWSRGGTGFPQMAQRFVTARS